MNKQDMSNELRELADTLQTEPNPIKDIVRLNEERYGLGFDARKEYDKLIEEVGELLDALIHKDLYNMLDAWNDILVIAIGSIRKAGYDPEKTLNEVIKEITSREQDPEQRDRWNKGLKEPGEKWQKNKQQDKETLYKADFEKAKIKEDR